MRPVVEFHEVSKWYGNVIGINKLTVNIPAGARRKPEAAAMDRPCGKTVSPPLKLTSSGPRSPRGSPCRSLLEHSS